MSYKCAVIIALVVLVSCDAKHADTGRLAAPEASRDAQPAEQIVVAAQHPKKARELQEIEHANKPQPKPGAPVSLVNNQEFLINPGEKSDINLRLRSSQQDGQMRLTVSGSEGLTILAGADEQEFLLALDHIYEVPLQVLAEQPGRYYAQVKVVIDSDGRQRARVISAIIQVGKSEVKTKRQKSVDSAEISVSNEVVEEQLIIQRARETILE